MSTFRTADATRSPATSAPRLAVRLLCELLAFAALLFVTRFIARGHLTPVMDQECHIGGIAADVLAHGVRFPLMVYAPNEYDNGSFFSGLLAAGSFVLFGRDVLALKLVTHAIAAAGAVAALWLLRGCLQELGLTSRRLRWTATAVLVIGIALAPRVVTLSSMYAVGNHAEGAAIDTILLALFVGRMRRRSIWRTVLFWALVGFMLYLNKGTVLVIPVLAVAEIFLAGRSWSRLAAAVGGFMLGAAPEWIVILQRQGMGWKAMKSKVDINAPQFPAAFLDSMLTLAESRIAMIVWWIVTLVAASVLLIATVRAVWPRLRGSSAASTTDVLPVTLAIVVSVTWFHLMAMTVMAQGGIDPYSIYGYPTGTVLSAVLVAWGCDWVAARWGERRATWGGLAAIGLMLVIYHPDTLTWGTTTVFALERNHEAAVCSWRFAEGFERAHDHGLGAAAETREQYAIEGCRQLTERDQVLDCIGGIARELIWRHGGKIEGGQTPAGLSDDEQRAYAFHYGTHRHGDTTPCSDFTNTDLTAQCLTAVQLDCLLRADIYTRYTSGRSLGRPHCAIAEPPMNGYWAAVRRDFLVRPPEAGAKIASASGWDADLSGCQPVFAACY